MTSMSADPAEKPASLAELVERIFGIKGVSSLSEALGPPVAPIFAPPSLIPPPPPIIRDRWFKDVTLHIDGYIFERCRFDRCTLVTQVGAFSFRDCYIAPDCQLYFQGQSLRVVRLLMHLLRLHGRVQPLPGEDGIYAAENQDGTFSVE